MNELLKELTLLVVTARKWLENNDASAPRLPLTDAEETSQVEAPQVVKVRKPRASKKEAAPVVPNELASPAATAPTAAPTVELTEAQSLDALYRVCAKVVEKFKGSTVTGFDRATNHLKQTYKVAKLADLPHAQRLQFIAWLTGELEKDA